jgi:inhibitor of KinA
MLNGLNPMLPTPQIFPVGDTAISVSFGNTIDRLVNHRVIALHQQLLRQPFAFWKDLIPAYASLTIVYDGFAIAEMYRQSPYQFVREKVEEALSVASATAVSPSRKVQVPVCYDPEFGLDNVELCAERKISIEELVRLHSNNTYYVYMLGFLPGFAYMGSVDKRIAAPRLTTPRVVPAGSVGIAGEQTGIYPLASPGGWNIVGRTPLTLFEATRQSPTLLLAGDEVTFTPISREEFNSYLR